VSVKKQKAPVLWEGQRGGAGSTAG